MQPVGTLKIFIPRHNNLACCSCSARRSVSNQIMVFFDTQLFSYSLSTAKLPALVPVVLAPALYLLLELISQLEPRPNWFASQEAGTMCISFVILGFLWEKEVNERDLLKVPPPPPHLLLIDF